MAQQNGQPQSHRHPAKMPPFMPHYEGSRILALQHKSWGGVGVQVKESRFNGPFCADLRSEYARFSVVLDLAGVQPEARGSISRPTAIKENTVHQMNFAPADCPVWACSSGTKYFQTLSLYFKHSDVGFLLEDKIDANHLFVPRLMFFDKSLMYIARLLAAECESVNHANNLYIEALTLAFLLRLADLERTPPERRAHGGLSTYQLRQVTEYLTEHLAENVTLQELASIAGVSRSYFSRAFRKSTGIPPHQWLLERRVSKSKEYLLSMDFSIAQVALAVGFSDQAHFSRAFSRIAGTSPAIWRRRKNQ